MRLVVAETATSTWNYHLRLVEPGEEKYGGGAGDALCGRALGWDTKIPLDAYGMSGHIPSLYCTICARIAREQKLPGYEEIDL